MTTMTDELRTLGVEIREVETTESYSMLRGLAVPYDTPADIGWFTEEFAPGSLSKSINKAADRRLRHGKGLPLLLAHDVDALPVGVSTEWEETPGGLIGTWRLDVGARAQEAAKMAADGLLNHLSIRFAPIVSQWTYTDDFNPELGPSHKDHVRRVEARLLETSMVSTPAFESATIQHVRSGEVLRERENQHRSADEWWKEFERLGGTR